MFSVPSNAWSGLRPDTPAGFAMLTSAHRIGQP